MEKRVLAIDFGASSGRAILGTFDGEKITLEEVHRFSNDPVKVGDTMYWDVLRLFYNIKQHNYPECHLRHKEKPKHYTIIQVIYGIYYQVL